MYPITINGTPVEEYRIIPGEAEVEKLAAEEFAKYCEKISGKRPCGVGPKDIFVRIEPGEVQNEDGFKVTVKGDQMFIFGGGTRGMMYAIYDIFQKYLGVRYFTPTVEKLGCGGNIPEGEYTYIPKFNSRMMIVGAKCMDADWCIKNKIDNYINVKYPSWHSSPYRLCNGRWQHTFERIFNTSSAGEINPCLSDRDNIAKIIEYTKKELRSDPNANAIHISQFDNHETCKCDRCNRISIEEGSRGGPLIRMINEVADAIKEEFPDVVIETFAYQFSRKPTKTAPRPNVMIQFCNIEACFVHPVYDKACEENRQMYEDFMGWKKLTPNINVWDYFINAVNYVVPFPNFDTIRQNMAFWADNDVVNMYAFSNGAAENCNFDDLRPYLLARVMENPYISEVEYKKLIDEFLETYYGAGWRYIRTYMDIIHAEIKRHHMHDNNIPILTVNPTFIYEIHDVIEGLWDKAEELAGDLIENVRRSRLQWTYFDLAARPDKKKNEEFIQELVKRNIPWGEGASISLYNTFDTSKNICTWKQKASNIGRIRVHFPDIHDCE